MIGLRITHAEQISTSMEFTMKRRQFLQQANLAVAAAALAVTPSVAGAASATPPTPNPQRGNPMTTPSSQVMTAAEIARQVNGKRRWS
jgi:hypothetical protein